MLSLNNISLHRYLLFRESVFTFQNGVSEIRGENRSGKSLIFNALEAALYPKDSSISHPQNSTVSVNYSRLAKKATNYTWIAKTSKSPKYSFLQNEEDMKPHKITDALDLLRSSVPISYPLFNSTVLLRGTKEHPLLFGAAAAKSEWLSGVLDLTTVYDEYHAKVKDDLTALQKEATKYDVLKSQLASLPVASDQSITIKAYEKAKEVVEANKSIITRLVGEISDAKTRLVIMDMFPNKEASSSSPAEIKAEISKKEKALMRIQVELTEHKAFDRYLESLEEYEKSIEDVRTVLGDALNGSLSKYEKKLTAINHEWTAYHSDMALYEKQTPLREAKRKYKDFDTDDYTSYDEVSKKLAILIHANGEIKSKGEDISSISELGKSCPTCGSKLDAYHIKLELASLRNQYRQNKSLIEKLQEIANALEVKSTKTIRKPVEPEMSESLLMKHLECIDAFRELKDLKPTAMIGPKSSRRKLMIRQADLETELETLREEYETQTEIAGFKRTAPEWAIALLDKGSDYIKKYHHELRNKIKSKSEERDAAISETNDCMSIITQYEADKATENAIKNQRDMLTQEMDSIAPKLKYLKALHLLLQAFGSSGLRLQALKESANRLTTTMTDLSPMFFDDNYTFEMTVEPRKLDLHITRNNIRGSQSSLSGSESRFFSLLFAMSLMHILPNRLRCDTMILDELEANSDTKSKGRYTSEIIPELKTLVPKIVVVSPLMGKELQIEADHRFRVVKNIKNDEYFSEIVAQ